MTESKSQDFMAQLQDGQQLREPPAALDSADFDMSDLAAKNRNRGNYRCSICGEPKKGHVCPLVPSNFKCTRCGLPKTACTCVAPSTRNIGIQAEIDEDMTTCVLDLSVQGVSPGEATCLTTGNRNLSSCGDLTDDFLCSAWSWRRGRPPCRELRLPAA